MYNLGVVDVFSVASRELRLVVPVGSIPYGIATDGTAVWVANNGAGTVSKLTTIQGGRRGLPRGGTWAARWRPGDIPEYSKAA